MENLELEKMSKHSKVAKKLFEKGYNCSQAVFAAFCDVTELDLETALKLSSSFGGGMGKLREVCGAVTGMFMVLGMVYGYSDPLDQDAKIQHYERIHTMGDRFKERHKSIICRDLLELAEESNKYVPEERTEKYYKERPCSRLVEEAAMMLDDYLERDLSGAGHC